MMNRLTEASSMAGITLVIDGVARLVADWKSPLAWSYVLGGLAAILKREGAAS